MESNIQIQHIQLTSRTQSEYFRLHSIVESIIRFILPSGRALATTKYCFFAVVMSISCGQIAEIHTEMCLI